MAIPPVIIQESTCSLTKFVSKIEFANSSMRLISFNLSLHADFCPSTKSNDLVQHRIHNFPNTLPILVAVGYEQ